MTRVKLYDIMWDLAIFAKQRKIFKINQSALSETNYAAALGDLLFDSFACFSLLVMWLLRKSVIGAYISPVVSIIVALYLMTGCIKRIKTSLNELDLTNPERKEIFNSIVNTPENMKLVKTFYLHWKDNVLTDIIVVQDVKFE